MFGKKENLPASDDAGQKNLIEEEENLIKIQADLGGSFPFAALWQDDQPTEGLMKFLPIVSVIISFITLILVIVKFK
jgi:hypothetical protein